VSLCVVIDDQGNVTTSTAPAGGAHSWRAPVRIASAHGPRLSGVSCGSPSFCVAVDQGGSIMTSTNPTGGKAAWSKTQSMVTSGLGLESVTCPSASLCIAGDFGGDIVIGQ
jgi:hypothetical protein